jgi:hypothetical protein
VKLKQKDLSSIIPIKIMAVDFPSRVTSAMPDPHMKELQERYKHRYVFTDHNLQEGALIESVPHQVLKAFGGFNMDRELSRAEIQFFTCLLVDLMFATKKFSRELVERLGVSLISGYIGCKDPDSVSLPSFKRLLNASFDELHKAITSVGSEPSSSQDFVIRYTFFESTDSNEVLAASEDSEPLFLRINEANPRALEVQFAGFQSFASISVTTLLKFVKKEYLPRLLFRLLGRAAGYQCSIPAGSRDCLSHIDATSKGSAAPTVNHMHV